MFWRSNVIATDSRPPLFALAQSGRYDATVLGCWWLAILIFAWHLDKPRRATAIVSGLLVGITALTQYYGAGALACCAATLVWTQRQDKHRTLYARDAAMSALLPIVIYAAYVALHWTDFAGQAAIQANRVRFMIRAFTWPMSLASGAVFRGCVIYPETWSAAGWSFLRFRSPSLQS